MIRRINFTGRRKLPRTHASVMLYTNPDGPSEFTAALDLNGADLPAEARVYVEAYYRASLQRFDFGTVASAGQYAGRRWTLDQLQSQIAFFRVKIVDERADIGRIIGIIERIKPRTSDERSLAETSLLWVNFVDLGDQIWRLHLSEDEGMPVLEVNRELQTDSSVSEFVRGHPLFFGLVYPAAVREILAHVLHADDYPSDEDDWRGQWLRLGAAWSGVPVTTRDFREWDESDRSDWINGVVDAFCQRFSVRAGVEAYLTGEGS
ncbi:MAG: hypothetical protein NZM00_08395 [Anaerolinea sp.]|nr:hypothetical protein [Anaerolinea sp.]